MLCALCHRTDDVRPFHLTHGIVIQLCRSHRSADFLGRRAGATFAARLEQRWAAHGVLTTRRRAALDAHLARHASEPGERARPGSYAWPTLRAEAERRFAAGEAPTAVIRELREQYADCPAAAPSQRTMRRWFSERRWLAAPLRTHRRTRRRIRLQIPRDRVADILPRGCSHNHLWPLVERWELEPRGP